MPPISTIQYILTVLGGVIMVLVIVILGQLISILKKANNVAGKVETTVENVENFVAKPVKIGMQIAEQIQYFVSSFQQKASKKHVDEDNDDET